MYSTDKGTAYWRYVSLLVKPFLLLDTYYILMKYFHLMDILKASVIIGIFITMIASKQSSSPGV